MAGVTEKMVTIKCTRQDWKSAKTKVGCGRCLVTVNVPGYVWMSRFNQVVVLVTHYCTASSTARKVS